MYDMFMQTTLSMMYQLHILHTHKPLTRGWQMTIWILIPLIDLSELDYFVSSDYDQRIFSIVLARYEPKWRLSREPHVMF